MLTASMASFLCGLHPVIYSVLLLLIPESPVVLVKQEKEKEAHAALSWLEATGFHMPYVISKSSSTPSVDGGEISKKIEDVRNNYKKLPS